MVKIIVGVKKVVDYAVVKIMRNLADKKGYVDLNALKMGLSPVSNAAMGKLP